MESQPFFEPSTPPGPLPAQEPPTARAPAPPPARAPWLRPGLWTAAVAAAATGGVLVRFGVAGGVGPFGVFTQVGRVVMGVTAVDAAPAQHAATIVGVLVHLLVATVWSLVFAIVALEWRGARRWLAAIVVAAFAWGVGQAVLPSVLRLGYGARARPPQIALLHVVLALSLAIGMRLALERRHER